MSIILAPDCISNRNWFLSREFVKGYFSNFQPGHKLCRITQLRTLAPRIVHHGTVSGWNSNAADDKISPSIKSISKRVSASQTSAAKRPPIECPWTNNLTPGWAFLTISIRSTTLNQAKFKGVVVEILDVRSVLVIIFEFSGVDYLHKHLMRTEFATFEKSKKYYVCMLKFSQKWFS